MTVSRTEWYNSRDENADAVREGIFVMEEAGWIVWQIKSVGEYYVVVYHRES